MKTALSSIFAALLLASISLVGCSEAERTYDCAQICDNYATCLDSSLDKMACVNKCEDKGDGDDSFAKKASDCEDCLDDKDCASQTLNCAAKCAEVVVVSTSGQGGAQN